MRLTARTEYAALAAVELARHVDEDAPVGLRTICEAQQVPSRFLVHILLELKRAGIVASVRGASGGYRLARSPETVTLQEIRDAVEGPSETPAPLTAELAASCRDAAVLCDAWLAAASAQAEILEGTTLADLVARSRAQAEAMYYI